VAFTIVLKVVSWWAVILVLAILNGALREGVLIPTFGTFSALIISGLSLSLLILAVAFVAAPGLSALSARGYWLVGLSWLILTLAFEFSFGVFVQHKALSELLQAYTFKGGNLWPLVLASTLVSPRLAASLRQRA
jgi:hypothetical protein